MSASLRHGLLLASLALSALLLSPAIEAAGVALSLPAPRAVFAAASAPEPGRPAPTALGSANALEGDALEGDAPEERTVDLAGFELADDVELVADAHSR